MRPIISTISRPSPDRFSHRRDKLAKLLARQKLSALLVTDPVNVHYLTGFQGDDSWLLVAPKTALILSDSRFTEQIAEECPGLEAHIRKPGTGETLPSAAAKIAENHAWRTIGLEGRSVNLADAETLRAARPEADWPSTAGLVEELRSIKEKEEIDTLREAIRIAERAFTILKASLAGSSTEKDLANQLEATIRSLGGECCAFNPICAVGPRAALPHALPTAHQCEENPLLLVDWGARFERYNSDLTRVLVTGKPTTKLAKVYGVVLDAQKAGIAAIKPGIEAGEVDRIARQVIEQAGYGRYFGHSLGHGLGLRVHETPGLRPKSTDVLRPGMVVTVEPGIYLPGWGGVRIEDDVLVTKTGHEVLTQVEKEFEENCLV